VNERIMLLGIVTFASKITWLRHILLISFPCTSAGFDEVWQAGRIDKTIVAITLNPKCVAAHQCNIVREAGMPDRVILRQQRVFTRQPVVIWHKRITDDCAKFLVLEHDNDYMLEVRNE